MFNNASNARFKSRFDGYRKAKKLYRCAQCSNITESPKPKRCCVCGHVEFFRFDSKIECTRYSELLLQQDLGLIRNLKNQNNIKLNVNGLLVCTYRADSTYFDIKKNCDVVEDVKPMSAKAIDNVFKIKARLFECLHGFKISVEKRK